MVGQRLTTLVNGFAGFVVYNDFLIQVVLTIDKSSSIDQTP
jgi:hypothetical protein